MLSLGAVGRLQKRLSTPHIRILLLITALFFVTRLTSAIPSTQSYYHGGNEAIYSFMAQEYSWENPLTPTILGTPAFSVTPLFSYLVRGSFALFGTSELAARLPSLLAATALLFVIYKWARLRLPANSSLVTVVLLATAPWFFLWAGRAQTDMVLIFWMTLSLYLFTRSLDEERWWPWVGLAFGFALFTKQPAAILLPVFALTVFFRPEGKARKKEWIRKGMPWILLGTLPVLAWFVYNYLSHPTELLTDFRGETLRGLGLTENLSRTVSYGLLLGPGAAVLLLAAIGLKTGKRRRERPEFWFVVLYLPYVLLRTPFSHDYYTLPLIPVFALWAGGGVEWFRSASAGPFQAPSSTFSRKLSVALVLVVLLAGVLVAATVVRTGDAGYDLLRPGGEALWRFRQDHPLNETLVISTKEVRTSLLWYGHLSDRPGPYRLLTPYNKMSEYSSETLNQTLGTSNATYVFFVLREEDRGGLPESGYPVFWQGEYDRRPLDYRSLTILRLR